MVILNAFFSRNEFAIGGNEKYNDCHIFLHPQASGKRPLRLNSLNYQIQGFSLQLKKWTVRSTRVGGFISPQNGNLRREKLLRVFRRCYILLF